MDPKSVCYIVLAVLVFGILFGILLGSSGLAKPLLIIAGIIIGGKILLPLIFGRR